MVHLKNWIDTLAVELGREAKSAGRAAHRSRRRILTNILGAIVTASPLVVAGALPVAAAKCKNNKDCGGNKKCRNGKCEADRCNNNNDCGPNKRCRDGDCEPIPNDGGGGGGNGGNGGWEKAGKNVRAEGVDEWKVDQRGNGYRVEFRGPSARKSGTLDLNLGGGGTFSYTIDQGASRFQLAASEPTVSGLDDRGDSFVTRWNRNRNQWETDQRSQQVAQRSKDIFRIGLAIIQDLVPPGSERSEDVTNQAGSTSLAQATCPASCCQDGSTAELLEGETNLWELPIKTRSIACEEARRRLDKSCTDYAVTCKGCCRELDSCDCACEFIFGSDYFCSCSIYGYPYYPECRAS